MTERIKGILRLAQRRGWIDGESLKVLRGALPTLHGELKEQVQSYLSDRDAEYAQRELEAQRQRKQDTLAKKWSR